MPPEATGITFLRSPQSWSKKMAARQVDLVCRRGRRCNSPARQRVALELADRGAVWR